MNNWIINIHIIYGIVNYIISIKQESLRRSIFDLFNYESYETCKTCLSSKMTETLFNERVDLMNY
jgi:hypothetical protein